MVDIEENPTAYVDFIRVPCGDGAVHFVPQTWQSDEHNNLIRRLVVEHRGHRAAAAILDSIEYLFSDGITMKEAVRRLRLIRKAVATVGGVVPTDAEIKSEREAT